MAKPTVVVVTGANRGIGHAICEQILSQHNNPIKLYACSRAGKDLGLKLPQKEDDTTSSIEYPTLDISDQTQINNLVNHIKSTDKYVNILINNASTHQYPNAPKPASEIINVNYYGTLAMCEAFLPLLRSASTSTSTNKDNNNKSRIITLSSAGSNLSLYHSKIQSRFRNPSITLDNISTLTTEYVSAITTSPSTNAQRGAWGDDRGYCFSKACINAMTVVLARENPDVLVNCCCPGWVDTEMGRIMGSPGKSVVEGARIPVRLALGDLKGVTGRYWANPGVSDTGDGRVMEW